MSDREAMSIRRAKGIVWFLRRFGVRAWWRYRVARRAGLFIDYAAILTADELVRLDEHPVPAPWEVPGALTDE